MKKDLILKKIVILLGLLTSLSAMSNGHIVPDHVFRECGAGIIPGFMCEAAGAVTTNWVIDEKPQGTELIAKKVFQLNIKTNKFVKTNEIFTPKSGSEGMSIEADLKIEMNLREKAGAVAVRILKIEETGQYELHTWWNVFE